MKGILKTMKSIKRMYVGRSGSGKSYECIELAKNHCNGITIIFAGIPIFKKEKDELRSCGFTFCDTKDLYELDPKKETSITYIMLILQLLSFTCLMIFGTF